jgi:hypothetical protein
MVYSDDGRNQCYRVDAGVARALGIRHGDRGRPHPRHNDKGVTVNIANQAGSFIRCPKCRTLNDSRSPICSLCSAPLMIPQPTIPARPMPDFGKLFQRNRAFILGAGAMLALVGAWAGCSAWSRHDVRRLPHYANGYPLEGDGWRVVGSPWADNEGRAWAHIDDPAGFDRDMHGQEWVEMQSVEPKHIPIPGDEAPAPRTYSEPKDMYYRPSPITAKPLNGRLPTSPPPSTGRGSAGTRARGL